MNGTGTNETPRLNTPVQYLRGVGPARAELLAKLNLHTACDVLFYFPRGYQDMSELRDLSELQDGETISVCGVVEEVELKGTGPGKSLLGVLLRQDGHFLRALWFNQAYMRDKFARGDRVMFSGTVRRNGTSWEMPHPRVHYLADGESPPSGSVLPVYGLTDGISQAQMRKIVRAVVERFSQTVDEVFPAGFLDEQRLWPIRAALPQIHMPRDTESLEQARRRFIYQELLVLQLALAVRRWKLTRSLAAPALPVTERIDERIRRLFAFPLTDDQRQAIDEICGDMQREYPMNRLLQGDVGTGKTVVAQYAMLLAVAHGYQACMMAPTEVLARQHARTLARDLRESRVRIGLLTGTLSVGERRETLRAIAAGEVDLVVGTHAVVHDEVQFARLGLVVIDEQHKFGVRQRAMLKQAGLDPHYLVMTATPIPRTISMTLFGDLDASTLRSGPPGRQKVHSYLADEAQRAQWWDFFSRKLREGRQGYVITPLVNESDTLELASVEQAYEQLVNGPLEAFRLDLVHGRMRPEAKDAAMEKFHRGETQVLVATSVVEVGVDVPNATLMTIESGERFGLAQLHQLRGRISRGRHPGFLSVFADVQTDESRQRLDAFTRTTDGFELAEIDFRLRGPGDLFSTRQHGLPPLRIADLLRDADVLEQARRDAQQLLAADPELTDPAFQRLYQMALARYGASLDLGDVG